MAKLGRGFYHRETRLVASELLGKYLVRQIGGVSLVCCITETEAYIGPIDKACHAFDNRRTPRTEILFGLPGYAYIYMIYGMYHCLNFVTEAEGTPCAVLIRGSTPRGNVDLLARSRFGVSFADLSAYQKKHFLDGPGNFARPFSSQKKKTAWISLAIRFLSATPGGSRSSGSAGRPTPPYHPHRDQNRHRLRRGSRCIPLEVFFMIFFDLDGTLIDSNNLWLQIDLDFLAQRHLPYTKAYSDYVSHATYQDAAAYTKSCFGLSESVDEIVQIWSDMAYEAYANTIPSSPLSGTF